MSRKLVLFIILILASSVISLSFHIPSAKATIFIEGHITSDTTWTPIDTYRVVNDTYIDSNASLTVEAGVHVSFDDNVSLIVEGGLNASGTESNPVIFTSSRVAGNPPDAYAGAWKTIEFKGNSTEQFTLKHTKIEYAVHGITINSLRLATIEKSEISNCSESGIKLLGENNVLIRENSITKNKNGIAGGITTYTDIHSGIIFTNNRISENQENGIYLLSYTPREGKRCIRNVTFSSNTISSNGINGACLFAYGGGGGSSIYNVNFLSNTISSNGNNGVYLKSYSSEPSPPYGFSGAYGHVHNITFSSNTISSNDGNGVCLSSHSWSKLGGDGRIHNVVFSSNTISSNGDDGAYLGTYNFVRGYIYNVNFSSNIISSNNGTGIHFYNDVAHAGGGDIYNVLFSSNIVSSSGGNGVFIYAGGEGRIYNASFSSNTILENWGNGVYASAQDYCKSSMYNLILTNDTVLANKQKGVWINGVNANISDNTLSHNLYGISLSSSSNSVISGNKIANNTYGIQLEDSSKNVVRQNIMSNNSYNFDLRSDELSEFVNWVGSSNLVDGKPVYYWINKHDTEVPLDAGYVALVNCTNIKVRNLTLARNNPGILLAYTRNSTIFWNNITNNIDGIHLFNSSNNNISENHIVNNRNGTVLSNSSNNTFCHNNFINNSKQVIIQTPNITDFWDNGVEGNFWSNYIGVDSNRDGIDDTPYYIDENNQDNYPLMGIFSNFNTTSEWHVQTICNSSISDLQFNGTAISFTVTGENGTTGFCRICVPKDLMDGPYIVLVNGEEVSHTALSCSNSTHSYLYFAYNHSTQEISILHAPTFEITQLLMVATALILIAVTLIVIVYRRKHNM